jgi:hypothetical protein
LQRDDSVCDGGCRPSALCNTLNLIAQGTALIRADIPSQLVILIYQPLCQIALYQKTELPPCMAVRIVLLYQISITG